MRVLNGHLKQYILKCLAEGYVNFDPKYAGCLHFLYIAKALELSLAINILPTYVTATQNKIVLSSHTVREPNFLAVIFAATVVVTTRDVDR